MKFKNSDHDVENTYVMLPKDFVSPRIGVDLALEVDVVTLFDVVWIEVRSQRQVESGYVCGKEEKFQSASGFPPAIIFRA